jgi:hypothetical protein
MTDYSPMRDLCEEETCQLCHVLIISHDVGLGEAPQFMFLFWTVLHINTCIFSEVICVHVH